VDRLEEDPGRVGGGHLLRRLCPRLRGAEISDGEREQFLPVVAVGALGRSIEDYQILGFTPRDFVIFGLPYKNPKTSLYVRRNGALTFTITGGAHGVPYAQDRLLVIWLATVFKVCGSPESNAIAFDSLREVVRSLGKASSGQQRQRIEAGFVRLFDAIFLAVDTRPNAVRRERYQLMRRMRLWRENDAGQPNQHSLWPNVLSTTQCSQTTFARMPSQPTFSPSWP
jgi:hypothetical protein